MNELEANRRVDGRKQASGKINSRLVKLYKYAPSDFADSLSHRRLLLKMRHTKELLLAALSPRTRIRYNFIKYLSCYMYSDATRDLDVLTIEAPVDLSMTNQVL